MYENVYWMKIAHLLSFFSLNLKTPFMLVFQSSQCSFYLYALEKTIPPLYVYYDDNMSNITPWLLDA